ncbi:MAG: hypothetical protein EOP88_23805 [Verrucomicrobiaceae bacterium]|nr:MAG: hypothetical protein EOP88_23805 [Verrucomicrobiaceae bacterium]
MKNALASLLIIGLCVSLGMNYSLWQRWKAWGPDKTAWIDNQREWLMREQDEADESTRRAKETQEGLKLHTSWIEKADTYLQEQTQEKELRKRRRDAEEKLREAEIE